MNRWTALYINLNGEMKKIGNVNPATKEIIMYPEGISYYDSPDLYYINNHGLYQSLN